MLLGVRNWKVLQLKLGAEPRMGKKVSNEMIQLKDKAALNQLPVYINKVCLF